VAECVLLRDICELLVFDKLVCVSLLERYTYQFIGVNIDPEKKTMENHPLQYLFHFRWIPISPTIGIFLLSRFVIGRVKAKFP